MRVARLLSLTCTDRIYKTYDYNIYTILYFVFMYFSKWSLEPPAPSGPKQTNIILVAVDNFRYLCIVLCQLQHLNYFIVYYILLYKLYKL